VVVVGDTTSDPLSATEVVFNVALAALVDVQVRVEELPAAIEVGFAEIPAVGGPPEETVTTAWAWAVVPEEAVATKL
jgi:hypothetical protein